MDCWGVQKEVDCWGWIVTMLGGNIYQEWLEKFKKGNVLKDKGHFGRFWNWKTELLKFCKEDAT